MIKTDILSLETSFNSDLQSTLKFYFELYEILEKNQAVSYLDKLKLNKLEYLFDYDRKFKFFDENEDSGISDFEAEEDNSQSYGQIKNSDQASPASSHAFQNPAFESSQECYAELNYGELVTDNSGNSFEDPSQNMINSENSRISSSKQKSGSQKSKNRKPKDHMENILKQFSTINKNLDTFTTFLEFLLNFYENSNILINFLKSIQRFYLFKNLNSNGLENLDNQAAYLNQFSDEILHYLLDEIFSNYFKSIYNYLHFLINDLEDWYDGFDKVFTKGKIGEEKFYLHRLLPLGLLRFDS